MNLLARFEYAYQGDVFYHVVQGNDLDTPNPGVPALGIAPTLSVPAWLQRLVNGQGGLDTNEKTKVDSYGIANLRIGVGATTGASPRSRATSSTRSSSRSHHGP